MIKSALFFFFLATSTLQGQCGVIEKDTKLAAHCMQETKVTQDTVNSYIDDPEKEPTEDFYCYLQCVFTGVGLINENGEVEIDLYKSMFVADVDCLKEVPNVSKCTDMEAVFECIKD